MSPEEVESLQQVGHLLLSRIGTAITAAILYGPYIVIYVFCARHLLRKRIRSAFILLGFLSVLSLLLTVNLAVDIMLLVATIRGYVITNPGQPLSVAYAHDKFLIAITTYCVWFSSSCTFFVIGDVVVAWRVWVLWPGNKLVKTTLIALLVASAGSPLISGFLHMTTSVYKTGGADYLDPSNVTNPSQVTNIIFAFSLSLSVLTNVIATALFSCRVYQQRVMTKAPGAPQATNSTMTLVFLAESGAAFCILQIVYEAIALSENPNLQTLTSIWQILTNYVAAAYPMMIIFLASWGYFSGHTNADSRFSGGAGNDVDIRTHMSFAAPPPPGDMGDELEASLGRSGSELAGR